MKNKFYILLFVTFAIAINSCSSPNESEEEKPKWVNYINTAISIPNNNIDCITIDAQGNKWIGTWDAGISVFDGTNYTKYYGTGNSGLMGDEVTCITIDAQGNKWIGTWDGISVFDGTNWTNYTEENSGLMSNNVTCITIDAQGNKWIGTLENYYTYDAASCISVFDGTNWTNYTAENSRWMSSDIACITIDAQGNKWIGTWDGISVFDGTNWTNYTEENSGLMSNNVTCITIDAQGNKWAGTEKGLYLLKR